MGMDEYFSLLLGSAYRPRSRSLVGIDEYFCNDYGGNRLRGGVGHLSNSKVSINLFRSSINLSEPYNSLI